MLFAIASEMFDPTLEETFGDRAPDRTGDLQFRKLLLYPTELRGQIFNI